jgi:hypothetical protein
MTVLVPVASAVVVVHRLLSIEKTDHVTLRCEKES